MATTASIVQRNALATDRIEKSASELAEKIGVNWEGLPPLRNSALEISRINRMEAVADLLEQVCSVITVEETPAKVEEEKPSRKRKNTPEEEETPASGNKEE